MTDFHAVRFYESSESIAAIVAAFLGSGLVSRQPALVIATPPHRAAIEAALRSINFSVHALERSGNLLLIDAAETLHSFMVHGSPDPLRFESVITSALERVGTAATNAVRVYDEMVEVLWTQGHPAGALRLEKLWDRLTLDRSCSLLCGHAVEHFRNATARSVCMHHSHVLGADGLPHPVL